MYVCLSYLCCPRPITTRDQSYVSPPYSSHCPHVLLLLVLAGSYMQHFLSSSAGGKMWWNMPISLTYKP
jgi:hypothetical protein